MYNQRQKTPLNTRDPRVLKLSEKYNLTPKTIAYIRAAIGSKRYTRDTLIEHIEFENKGRMQAIDSHYKNKDISAEQREKLIEYTQINIDFRNGVVDVLRNLTHDDIVDICN